MTGRNEITLILCFYIWIPACTIHPVPGIERFDYRYSSGYKEREANRLPFLAPVAGLEPMVRTYFSSPQRTRSLRSLGGPPGPLSPSGFAPIRFIADYGQTGRIARPSQRCYRFNGCILFCISLQLVAAGLSERCP